jgi:hypothetical protein
MYTSVVNALSNFPLACYLLLFTESCLAAAVVVVVYSGEQRHIRGLSQTLGGCNGCCLFSVLSWFTSLLYIRVHQSCRHSDATIDHD